MIKIIDKPDLYDLLYNDVTEDINMYIKLLENSKNVLEFGCGTGRVTIPLAMEGHQIEAVDLSEKMLNCLKKKIVKDKTLDMLITPVLGNMCSYTSNKKHDAIIIPLTSFNYLLTKNEQIECLKSIEKNLDDEGFALIELLSEKTFFETNKNSDFVYIKKLVESQKKYYKYFRKTELNLNNRMISQSRLFEHYIDDKIVSKEMLEWKNCFITIEDFKNLIDTTSLRIDRIYGNCNLEKYTEESEDIFIKLIKK